MFPGGKLEKITIDEADDVRGDGSLFVVCYTLYFQDGTKVVEWQFGLDLKQEDGKWKISGS